MNVWLGLGLKSAWSRRTSMSLVVVAIALSTALVLFIHQVGQDAKSSFSKAVSGVDLIVGARASPLELLLNTVFQIGRGTALLPAATGDNLRTIDGVAWAVPVALGDYVQRQPVVATSADYFEHVQSAGQSLVFAQGRVFDTPTEIVLGIKAAQALGASLGSEMNFSHGKFSGLAKQHDHVKFQVVGLLAATGSPVDQAVWVSLEGFQAVHAGASAGTFEGLMQQLENRQGGQVNAWLLGLNNPATVFRVRRHIESMDTPPMTAVMPGVALDELWQTLGIVQSTLAAVAWLVALGSGMGLAATLLMSLHARRKEIAVLRACGAPSLGLVAVVLTEALATFCLGALLGIGMLHTAIAIGGELLRSATGVVLSHAWLSGETLVIVAGLGLITMVSALLPAWLSATTSLNEGLNPRSL